MWLGDKGIQGGMGAAKAKERESEERESVDQKPCIQNDFNLKWISIIF